MPRAGNFGVVSTYLDDKELKEATSRAMALGLKIGTWLRWLIRTQMKQKELDPVHTDAPREASGVRGERVQALLWKEEYQTLTARVEALGLENAEWARRIIFRALAVSLEKVDRAALPVPQNRVKEQKHLTPRVLRWLLEQTPAVATLRAVQRKFNVGKRDALKVFQTLERDGRGSIKRYDGERRLHSRVEFHAKLPKPLRVKPAQEQVEG